MRCTEFVGQPLQLGMGLGRDQDVLPVGDRVPDDASVLGRPAHASVGSAVLPDLAQGARGVEGHRGAVGVQQRDG